MDRAASDPIIGKSAIAVESFEVERPFGLIVFPLEFAQEARQLVPDKQESMTVLVKQFTQLFDTRVIDDPTWARLICAITVNVGGKDLARTVPVTSFDSLSRLLGRILCTQFIKCGIDFRLLPRRVPVIASDLLNRINRREGCTHGWAFHGARPTDVRAPKVRNDFPIIRRFGLNANVIPNDCGESAKTGHCGKIRWRLLPVRYVENVIPQRSWQQFRFEDFNRR
ncbi:hypothetical protein MJC1_03072 [Methylocystis sp. MJC1]|nr:hypothetical protein MJC1_03072 [Methylocystis sp. MJC1]